MPTRRRSSYTLRKPATSRPATTTLPLMRAAGVKSSVRLMHFKSVVLPELAGPMMPKICFSGMASVIWRRAVFPP